MTAERRLAKLESTLSPKAATMLWLAEAQQFGSLPAYVAWLIDQPVSAAPLERVPAQARAGAIEAMRRQPREIVQEAAHGAARDAVFLVELVLKLNSEAEERTTIQGLRYVGLFWEMRAIRSEAELVRRSRSRAGRTISSLAKHWQAWCEATAALLTGLHTSEEARLLLERRYLDGHPALFPDAIEDWGRLQARVERLASLGDALPPLMEGRRRGPRSAEIEPPALDLDALRARAQLDAPTLAARLVDEARAAALDVLGDAEGATAIVARRMREDPKAEA
ncbi:MAG: hypothetical protein P4L84_07060 [Isosphaeraceae bacterium]|nr:hypothetical protein [Isosphaeraceae bacterium]